MAKTGALILAAGRGSRMGTETPKQFLKIGGKPLFLYSVEVFLPLVDRVLLVTGEQELSLAENYLRAFGLDGCVRVVPGGRVREESSYKGLCALLEEGDFEYVLIHDAARANVSAELVKRCLETVQAQGTAVAAVPATDTMKLADENGIVTATPDRRRLFSVQTPQGFRTELLLGAFRKLFSAAEEEPLLLPALTDDSMVVESFSTHPVKLFPGDYANKKITVPGDLIYFEKSLGQGE